MEPNIEHNVQTGPGHLKGYGLGEYKDGTEKRLKYKWDFI